MHVRTARRPPEQDAPPKPRLRGRLHQAAFMAAIPAGLVLVATAPSPRARVATAIYALSLITLFGTSAAYHRLPWSPRAHRRMKKLDHSAIFVLIAGTYTPLGLLALRGAWSAAILGIVWTGAAVGVALKFVRIEGWGAVAAALYASMGWLAVVAAPELVRTVSPVALGLLLAGGIAYTVGQIILGRNRPDPWPSVFGYHEIWHALVIVGSACHFAAIAMVASRAA